MQIVYVEDHVDLGEEIADFLEDSGHRVERFSGGKPFLEWLATRSTSPDVMVFDLGLPDIDGSQLILQARSAHPDCGIVGYTAWDVWARRVRVLEAGADEYLLKSESLNSLHEAIIRAARTHGRYDPGNVAGR